MKIKYVRNYEYRKATEELFLYVCVFYPMEKAILVPAVQIIFGKEVMKAEEAEINRAVINYILNNLNDALYYGTQYHDGFDLYSDYYETYEAFINILYTIDSNSEAYITAIFYTSKQD